MIEERDPKVPCAVCGVDHDADDLEVCQIRAMPCIALLVSVDDYLGLP